MESVVIADAARRHGVPDVDILHAYRNHIRGFIMENSMTMLIGPAEAGTLLEVGVVLADDLVEVVVHAMPARSTFLWT